MQHALLIIVIFLLFSLSPATYADDTADSELDQQMIEVLALSPQQAPAYTAVMQQQRKAFFALKARAWEEQLALYHETYALLKPILSEQQLNEFIAIIDSVIEGEEEQRFVAMEN